MSLTFINRSKTKKKINSDLQSFHSLDVSYLCRFVHRRSLIMVECDKRDKENYRLR